MSDERPAEAIGNIMGDMPNGDRLNIWIRRDSLHFGEEGVVTSADLDEFFQSYDLFVALRSERAGTPVAPQDTPQVQPPTAAPAQAPAPPVAPPPAVIAQQQPGGVGWVWGTDDDGNPAPACPQHKASDGRPRPYKFFAANPPNFPDARYKCTAKKRDGTYCVNTAQIDPSGQPIAV